MNKESSCELQQEISAEKAWKRRVKEKRDELNFENMEGNRNN